MGSSDRLFDIAAAVADGTAVDWGAVSSHFTSEEDRQLLAELEFIAGIGRSHGVAPAKPPVGRWGPLTILETVGQGTFGDVYRAWDTRLDREVALKILRRDASNTAGDSTVVEEGRLLARVRHPHVVTVYGAERIDGSVGVWMEFVHGKTLEQELGERGPFDADEAIIIGAELADALAAVHRAGLVHRDVKAQNVLRDEDGRLVLTDFGAGREVREESPAAARDLAGTPLYVAPEVLDGEPATPASDIYSLGVLLFHLLTGNYPVAGRTLEEIRENHRRGTHTAVHALRPELPSALVDVITRALEPDPGLRFASAEDLRAALDRSRAGTRVRRRVVMAAIAAILGAVGALIVAGFGWSPLARTPYDINPRAYEQYLIARSLLDSSSTPPKTAAERFEQVIATNPNYAPAYAGLASAYARMSTGYLGIGFDEGYSRIRPAAMKALELDPLLAEAHAALGLVYSRERDWARAERSYRRAIELNPNLVQAYTGYALWTLFPQGRLDEATGQLESALARDPLAPDARTNLAYVQISAGRYAEAVENSRQVLARDPKFPFVSQFLARALFFSGRVAEAIALFEKQQPYSRGFLGYAYAKTGRRTEARAIAIEQANFPLRQALAYAGLEDKDRTFAALERAAAENDHRVGQYLTYPELAFLRADPRLAAFRKKMGLP